MTFPEIILHYTLGARDIFLVLWTGEGGGAKNKQNKKQRKLVPSDINLHSPTWVDIITSSIIGQCTKASTTP